MSLFVALTPLACGSDDGDDTSSGGSSTTGGKAGSSSTGGKGGTGGKSTTGGSANVAGDDAVGGGGDAAGGVGGAPVVGPARLRVVHASPNAPSVDIYAFGSAEVAVTGVAYGEATAFMEVEAGTVAFDLRETGADADSEPAFTTEAIDLEGDTDYTLVAAGDFTQPEEPDVGFRVLALGHDFEAASLGHAMARVVHATSAWSTVDLDLIDTVGIDVPALAPFTSESNVELPAAADIDVAFQTDADGTLTKLTVPELTAGDELFVIATGNPGLPFRAPANGFALLVVNQDGDVSWVMEHPWLHLVHASDVNSVDVYNSTQTAAAAKLVNDLEAGGIAAFQLPAHQTGFSLKAVALNAASGAATALATGPTSTISAGEHYLSFIAGNEISTIHEQFDLTQPTKTLLRGVHASATLAQIVDFGLVSTTALTSALISGVAPGNSSAQAGVAIDPGVNTLGAAVTTTLSPLLAQKAFTSTAAFHEGERGFVLLVGAGELWFVDTSVAGWPVR